MPSGDRVNALIERDEHRVVVDRLAPQSRGCEGKGDQRQHGRDQHVAAWSVISLRHDVSYESNDVFDIEPDRFPAQWP
ncbi:hypothetical protein JXA47_13640 [Candidatus Sumerlaeota bacterium]|nr:hypothetical protein [Candidatus Sumerlaeota bacterium]